MKKNDEKKDDISKQHRQRIDSRSSPSRLIRHRSGELNTKIFHPSNTARPIEHPLDPLLGNAVSSEACAETLAITLSPA